MRSRPVFAAMERMTGQPPGIQQVSRAVRRLGAFLALALAMLSQLCFGQDPDCGGGRWATAMADGYVVGTLQRYSEGSPAAAAPVAEMLVSTAAGGVFLRTFPGLDVKSDWRGRAHVFLFTNRTDGVTKTFLAAFDARLMAGSACLDRSTVVANMRSQYPKRGCALLRPVIRRLRSHRYQDAIDRLYAMRLDHEELTCLADYVANTSRLQLDSFRVPWDSGFESQYFPPFDSVGALVEVLLYHKLEGVAPMAYPQSADEHELHRLVWRDMVEAIRVD